jgi:hypothetical protein
MAIWSRPRGSTQGRLCNQAKKQERFRASQRGEQKVGTRNISPPLVLNSQKFVPGQPNYSSSQTEPPFLSICCSMY